MVDCAELGAGHRTTYGHFLSKGKWDHEKVENIQCQTSFRTILSVAEQANQPVYLSVDDTVVSKKKPSCCVAHPMEGIGWYYSHLEGKKVYGYQIHAAIASTGNTTLCYSLRRCCPEHGTKVDMTVEVIDSIQESKSPVYVLTNSWYTNANGTLTIDGGTITTDAVGGAGVFAYGDGTAYVSDTTIDTAQDTSGGIHVAGAAEPWWWMAAAIPLTVWALLPFTVLRILR